MKRRLLVIISLLGVAACSWLRPGLLSDTDVADGDLLMKPISAPGYQTIQKLPDQRYRAETATKRSYRFEEGHKAAGRLAPAHSDYIFNFNYNYSLWANHDKEQIRFQEALRTMARTLFEHLAVNEGALTIFPTTFVSIDDLYQSSTFGRYCTEELATQLHDLYAPELSVIEPRKAREIMIKRKEGEFVISRESDLLTRQYRVNMILSGAYTVTPNQVILNTRLVSAKDNQIDSSASMVFPRRDNLFVNYLLSSVSDLKHAGGAPPDQSAGVQLKIESMQQ